ncbi:hypothetical protein TNCV_2551341 [Trichonephila clavipes]|nr:hypothetical protein TNCV_2551341 [Trichonephila clavipes]
MYKNALKEDLIRVVEELDGTVQSTDTIVKLKTKIENSSTFESDPDFVKTLIQNCIDERVSQNEREETATHIGIREAEDWFRPIDLAKDCDIYISSRSGSHKEIPITYGYTQDPFKNRSQNFKPKVKENYPNILKEKIKIAIYAVIHLIAQETVARSQFLNSSLIRVKTPSEEIITLSSCFGEKRMVEVKPINISLNQHSTSLSVRTAISPTLTEEFIIHPSVYSEIEKLGHAKSDVLLNESGSSLGANSSAYSNSIFYVANVIENCSYDLTHVKNFDIRNDLSSLIKNYKCNKIKITKLKLSIVREKCSDIVLCKKANGAMKTSSVEFISQSPTPSPMNSKYRRLSSGLHGSTAADSVRSEWPLWHAAKAKHKSSCAGAAKTRTETCEIVEEKQKLLDIREKKNARGARAGVTF